MEISVVIVNWNGRPHLRDTLAAVRAQTLAPKRIVVVDNGSTDGSQDDLAHIDWPNLKVVFLDRNTGFACGNNAAWPHLVGDAVALLNNDAVPEETWLEQAAGALLSASDVGMVACKILRMRDRGVIDKCGHLIYGDGLNRGWGTGFPDQQQFDQRQEALWPDGCAALFRLSSLREVGFFDEAFFCYGEDADLGFRMRWAGYRCIFEPTSRVFHHHSASLGKFSPYKAYLIERNRWWVLIKNFPISWILWSPVPTALRYAYNLRSLLAGKGSASGFQSEHGATALIKTLLKANIDGILGIPQAWRKRKQGLRRLNSSEMAEILKQFRISAKELTMED